MRTPVAMPKLGYAMQAGRIAAWTKQVGDRITRGEVIAEIEMDKGIIELEALTGGTLVEIVRGAGEEVPGRRADRVRRGLPRLIRTTFAQAST